MSYDEKRTVNRWRISKEVTLGELLLILTIGVPLIIAAVRLSDRVEDHEKRLNSDEITLNQHAARLAQHDTAIAVLQSEHGASSTQH